MVVAITDSEDMESPLEDTESIVRFIVLDKTGYTPMTNNIEDDITSPLFGKPRMYKINVAGISTKNVDALVRAIKHVLA